MPKPKTLKVFRTPIGFHDAYVAAPTKKAALEAWGSHRNLFTLGEAEEVLDPQLTHAPLAEPGVVIKVSRGTATEQLQALPPNDKLKATKSLPEHVDATPKPIRTKALPRPSRAKLEQAETALADLAADNAQELTAIDEEIETLRKRRAAFVVRHSNALAALQDKLDRAQSAYDTQLAKWRTDS